MQHLSYMLSYNFGWSKTIISNQLNSQRLTTGVMIKIDPNKPLI